MRIESGSIHNLLKTYKESQNKAAKSEKAGQINTDLVEISPEAKFLQKILAEEKSLPDIRQKEVEAIENAVKDGRYILDSREIAKALLNEIREK